ncbi:hypothetical protein EMIT0P253_10173 [Pseudomonas sp. IT-P253]
MVSLGGAAFDITPVLAVELHRVEQTSLLSLRIALQRFADTNVADHVYALAMNGVQRGLGLCFGALFKLGKFKAALTVELVLDDVFGCLSHGHTCLFSWWGVTQLSFELERRIILIE